MLLINKFLFLSQPMFAQQTLMTEKERAYVASCFNKTVKFSMSGLSIDRIFASEKMAVDISASKKEVKQAFGKLGKRSRKWLRPAANTETNFMAARLILSELYDTNSILKNIVLDDESRLELEESSLEYLREHFCLIPQNSKFYFFLFEFLAISSQTMKAKIFDLIVENIANFNDQKVFETFLAEIKDLKLSFKMPVSKSLFTSETGYSYAIFLLQSFPKTSKEILDCFIESNPLIEKSFYKLVNLLYALSAPAEKARLQKKIKTVKSLNISELVKELSLE